MLSCTGCTAADLCVSLCGCGVQDTDSIVNTLVSERARHSCVEAARPCMLFWISGEASSAVSLHSLVQRPWAAMTRTSCTTTVQHPEHFG
jgi:hypothetical protein